MSCSSYCQGLQSCLEPGRLVEPRVLRLKLAPSKVNISRPSQARKSLVSETDHDSQTSNDNVDMGGYSFLEYLDSISNNTSEANNDKVYVPPNFKRSSSVLSEKSLEMCTESLGSETGSDGGESSDEMALLSSENENHETTQKSKFKETRRMSKVSSFPPPLTSISGSSTLQMKPRREGGRLVLKAVAVSSHQPYFQAERVNGCLRLHLIKDSNSNCEKTEKEEKEEEEEEKEEEEGLIEEGEDEKWGEEMEDNSEDSGDEMGMEKLGRPRRCKEGESGSKSLLNWEPFWVAT